MFDMETVKMLAEGVVDTLYMTLASTLFAYIFGMIMGVILVVCRPDGIRPCVSLIHAVLGCRGEPDPLLPLSHPHDRGHSLHPACWWARPSATTPLSSRWLSSAAPFVARLIESSLLEVDRRHRGSGAVHGGVHHGRSSSRCFCPRPLPSLINGSAIAATTILGYSAMSGAVGGGGLGKLAIMYGYNRYQTDIMFITVVLLIVIVQVFQSFGNWATKRSDRRIS